jgi:asparagine synthase (glutamine-hydrolysing)
VTDNPEPFVAGSYDLRGGSPEERRARLAQTLGAADSMVEGPLAVAVRGAATATASERLCVLEGALYNLDEIAAAAGLPHSEGNPAAVLAAAHDRLGERLVELLRGDFALLLWDGRTRRGLIARDQVGGRGLVWHAEGGRLLFASETHQLLALLGRTPRPDPVAIAHWLTVSGLPTDRTLYDGIRRLRAGHLLRLEDGRFDVKRYWLPHYRSPLRAPRAELAERLREAVELAVARRTGPGTGTGVMLSGGLDSATVAAAAAMLPEQVRPARAYSATFPRHPTIDESELIARLCEAFGLAGSRAVVRGGSVLAGALPYLERWRLPPVSPNLFFWGPLLERAAADGTHVMLDGEGGDELFGLSPALIADRVRRGRLFAARRLVYRFPGANGRPSKSSVRRVFREHGVKAATPLAVHRAVRRLRGPRRYALDWLTDASARAYAETDDVSAWKRYRGPRWWAYLVDITTSGMGPGLLYDHSRRRAAMAGIQPRHPLMDVDVIELVLQLPPELAYDPRHSRPLLREAMAGLMPDEVRLRPTKSTFDALFHECLAGPDLPILRELLGDPRAEVGAYVDLGMVHRRLLEPAPPAQPAALMEWALYCWRLVTAELWLRSAADPAFAGALHERLPRPDYDLAVVR